MGSLGAAAAGVVFGLLSVPEKGSEIRKRIRHTAGGWVNNLNKLFSVGTEEPDHVKDKVRQAKSGTEEEENKLKENFG